MAKNLSFIYGAERLIFIKEKIMGVIHLEYKENIKPDYCKNYFEIYYEDIKNIFKSIYLYNSQYGTIKIENGKKEIHKWETEDEAQAGSYLKRNYPAICLDGITSNPIIENNIIIENMNYIKTLGLTEKELLIIEKAIKYLNEVSSKRE
jgi:hypothetical protein